ncbi:MAG: tetratricopeptide repeat protein [Verrucomicrobiales bacterium]
MKTFSQSLVALFLLGWTPFTAAADKAADLEARLKETAEISPAAAGMMLELMDHYWQDGQPFGLIRTAGRFSRTQTAHPRRAEATIKLMDGFAATARHEDVITTGRQFLEMFPNDPLANEARDRLATACERTARGPMAASLRRDIWKNGGAARHGIQALDLFIVANNPASLKQATALAIELTEKLSTDAALTECGIQGMKSARRSEQWAEGLVIAKNLVRRQAPADEAQQREIAFLAGQFESQLGQHANAVDSFRKAIGPGRDEAHRSLISAMGAAKIAPKQIEAEARRYLAAFPRREDRYGQLARAAYTAAEAKESSLALALAEEVMLNDPDNQDLPQAYVNWCGEDAQRAARGLLKVIAGSPTKTSKLRAVLALDVYRDRLKDTANAREAAAAYLKSPPEEGRTEDIVKFLYESAPSDEAFRQDLATIVASSKAFPHVRGFHERLWKPEPSEKNRHREWQAARGEHQNDNIARLWRQTREDGGKAGQSCKELLQANPTPEQRRLLLARLAYVYRHHLGGKAKEGSAEHYQNLCREMPKDAEAASRWLEAADYSTPEMRVAAANHLLGIPPANVSSDNWVRLCATKNQAVTRKAIPWITASSKESDQPLSQSARLGDIMSELGMKTEAVAWWRSRMDLDPMDGESVSCALRVAATLKPEEAASFLKSRYEAKQRHNAAYAAEVANIAFRSGDIDGMEPILKSARTRADQSPFSPWNMGEWPARGWLEAARGSKDLPDEKKARVFRIVRDLKMGRLSAEAGMELMDKEPRTIDRLLNVQRLILMADPHHESWKRLYPFAQSALAKNDPSLAAAILNGLLNSIGAVGEAEKNDARALLRKAYSMAGGLGADIPSDSPLAPLLQVVLHLRLGETELAERAYQSQRALFDAHRNELPVELILFAAETHINKGGAGEHERAEDILRGWLLKFGEAQNTDIRDKARIQLLLARNYQQAGQYDIARAEFTTVLNLYKDQPEAIQARFGIGETFMAQKVYEQAAEIFTDLSENPLPSISIRAKFMLGVVALRQDQHQESRRIFLSVLENSPDADLANETLFNLAEVYGIEQRFLAQLETLRTVGRLGHESNVWHTPGTALSVIVQDPDLGISHGNTRIPVLIRTEPGDDREESFLTSGGAGRGIFLTEVPTLLGVAEAGDGTLQLTGGDTIVVDYPEDFKKQFQFEFLSNTRLRVASDGSLDVASSEIVDEDKKTFTENLKEEIAQPEVPVSRSVARPKDQVKPGNLIYIQAKDGDRDLTNAPDKVGIKLTSASGDEVQVEIAESSAHGGVFQGTVATGELPAGAKATDSALDHNALMAIDHDPKTFWRSEPDGSAPKSLTIDMKELRAVESVALSSPDTEQEAPVRMRVRGSHDGRYWYLLDEFPPAPAEKRITFADKQMQLRIYKIPAKELRESYTWEQIAELVLKSEPTETRKVDGLAWQAPENNTDAHFLVWSGSFVQERDGAVRLGVTGAKSAIMLDGKLELPLGEDGRTVDVFLGRGSHELTIFSLATPATKAVEAQRARESRQSSAVKMLPFSAADFDVAAVLGLTEAAPQSSSGIKKEANTWSFSMPSRPLRFIDFEFLEYRGESIAVSNVQVEGGGKRHTPPAEDVLELAGNNILELAPGDTVTVSYLDEITAGGRQRNRLLTKDLTATYHNGTMVPITYGFNRAGDGSVQGSRKELLRFEPGERIVAEVTDFDLDIGLDRDSVEVEVQVNADAPIKLTAVETGPSTGVFTAEIETANAATEGKIAVKRGDKLYLRYTDRQNIFPGHASPREAVVLINEPTEAIIQIVESQKPFGGPPAFSPVMTTPAKDHVATVDYRLPLTIEVIDPDEAKNSRSEVSIDVTTTQGTKSRIRCFLSRDHAPPNATLDDAPNPALLEGRFVGRIPLMLGGIESPATVPVEGAAISATATALPGMRVLNVTGADTLTASYQDVSRPDGKEATLDAKATLRSAATLRITDSGYAEDVDTGYVGKKLFILLEDPDRDLSDQRDKAMVRIMTSSGEDETVELEETVSHSGIFSGAFPLIASSAPKPANFEGGIECFFGDALTVGYLDNVPHTEDGQTILKIEIPLAVGTDGQFSAFSKVFKDEELATQTRFHIAESYFELFKGQRKLDNEEESTAALNAGKRVLRELHEDHPDPKYKPRVSYLLGQFAQETKDWNDAIAAYGSIVSNYPEHNLAPDALYKLGQCHEEAGELDEALESYVTLAATYPKSPLIANVMLRINEHFYVKEDFAVAATVGIKFVERFPNHEWAPKMAFRIGQCHYKMDEFIKAGSAFDAFVKRYPEQELTAQALFWAGESYRMGKDIPNAFRRYNRCRWDFPESDAAKYSRGRLALPELLNQFDREANLNE